MYLMKTSDLYMKTNKELSIYRSVVTDKYDVQELKKTLEEHVKYTNSDTRKRNT